MKDTSVPVVTLSTEVTFNKKQEPVPTPWISTPTASPAKAVPSRPAASPVKLPKAVVSIPLLPAEVLARLPASQADICSPTPVDIILPAPSPQPVTVSTPKSTFKPQRSAH